MTINFDSLVLYVQDVDKLKDFYTTKLHCQVTEEIPGEWVLLRAGHASIGLHRVGEAYRDLLTGTPGENSNAKMVFAVDADIHQLREHLVQQQVDMQAVKTFDNYPYWLCDGYDPEGNVFQLKQAKEG